MIDLLHERLGSEPAGQWQSEEEVLCVGAMENLTVPSQAKVTA